MARETDEQMRERWADAYRRCFACGTDNPIGLRLRFERHDGGARAIFAPRPEHQGWGGVLHGGLVFTLLDEALAYAALFELGPAVTADFHARLRNPGPIDETLIAFGRVKSARQRMVEATATVTTEAGLLVAEAEGKFMLIDEPPNLARQD
jgi:acyl-coenzyme A thioesterase PaaI-like protein